MGVRVERIRSSEGWATAAGLIRDYLAELPFDVAWQDVDVELAELPMMYGPPVGAGFLAVDDEDRAVGVVGVRRFGHGAAELKRMYVLPEARGTGAGRALAEAAIAEARRLGYERLLLDTVASLAAANALYESLGWVRIDPYRYNPQPDARYLALDL